VLRTIQELPCTHGHARLTESGDAMRWLVLTDQEALTEWLWTEAVRGGACGILLPQGETFLAMLGDDVQTALSSPQRAWHPFPHCPTFVEVIEASEAAPRARQGTFVHLHTHTEYSALDGLSTMREVARLAAEDGNPALAVTDHGTCAGHPALQRACDEVGIKPIFGLEAYFVDDRLERPGSRPTDFTSETKDVVMGRHAETVKRLRDYNHLILLAKDDQGLHNLWALSTEGYRDGFYYKPRIDWDSLRRHAGGLVATSACLGGPLSRLLLDGHRDRALARLSRFVEIFGGDFYLELQPGDQDDQRRLNQLLVALARELNVPLVAAADGHFPTAAEADIHKTWLACQTSADNEAYWHFDHTTSEAEMRSRLMASGLDPQAVDEAVDNTVRIADQCNARIESKIVMPVYFKHGGYDRDAEKLREFCEANWSRIKSTSHSQQVYRERFEREFDLISRKKYCGYFLMVADYVCWAKDNGILVGPGRGSGAGSLIAFLLRITEVDPVQHDILFERFITEGRETLPDFDVDFPASKRTEVQEYIRDRWGGDNVLRVGTHLRYKSKGILNKLFGVFRDREQISAEAMVDARKISALIAEAEAGTAGLGLSWDELWAQMGDQLDPYRQRYPEIFELAERLVGRLNSYGQHPAGMVISTEGSLMDKLPLRRGEGEEGLMISQFEFDDLDTMGFIKFDILTIRTLDTLQATVDGAREHFGIEVDVYDFDAEYADPMVWDEIGDGYTLGMFQIETASGTRLAKRMQPRSIADLADMGSIVRPGPMRSGLTESYLRRRAGEEPVHFPDPRLAEFLRPTQGVMIFQEQVMQACMTLAGYTSTEADGVRKILGKKRVDQVVQAGHKFVDGCVVHGMDKASAQVLWDQMAEFAKYGFGKAHAVSYAMITYWTAWWKVHYPVPALTALLSTVDKERVPEFVQEARRLCVAILPPDINISGRGFRPDGVTIRYGLDAIKGVGGKAVEAITSTQPYFSYEDYIARKGPAANSGVTMLLAKVGAFDSILPYRRGLVERLEGEKNGTSTQCVFKQGEGSDRETVCTFDWDTEPREVNQRTGKLKKAKPLPSKCTKACRRYTAPEPVPVELSEPYTAKEIRTIEQEMLGVQLSSTAFDMLEDADRQALRVSAELLHKGVPGVHLVAGTITRLRKLRDRTDREMAFFNLSTETVDIDVACFADAYALHGRLLKLHSFVLCDLRRDARGSQLKTISVLDS
jgi:DNA polymerase-3 subunit alpha